MDFLSPHVLGQTPQYFIFSRLLFTTPLLSQQPCLAVSISSVLLLSPVSLSMDICQCLFSIVMGLKEQNVNEGTRRVTSREGSIFIISTSYIICVLNSRTNAYTTKFFKNAGYL